MSDNRTAEHKTLEDCKNEIARKHHWEKWSDLLYTGMDEEILLLYHAEATEMFYSQQTASLREENDKMGDLLTESQEETDLWKNKALELQEEVERLRGLLKNVLPMAEDGYTLHKKNGSHQEFLSEDRELLQSIREALSSKESKPS